MINAKPSMWMLRWLALGAAAGAALTLALSVLGLQGPWQGLALVLALLSVFSITAMVLSMRQRDAELEDAQHRAQRDEAELVDMKRELDRHAQLEHQMRDAKQAADAAVMAKGEFLATMSHEIRTPLNGIVPMLDLLMHANLAADHGELVRTAYTSSQQMLRIVDDILDYSKLEADKLELESTGFNLRELIEGVLQLMERPAQSKGLRLSLQVDPSVRLPVRGDPVRLRQVIGNLVSNAVKFTERGSVSVSVRRIGETAAQHQLRFEVRDSGIGIPPEAQGRLFQAFSQADASTTRLYGGTGLGLAISKRIVDLMGGRIGVDSERGQGATFWFEIPLLKVHGDMQPPEASTTTGGRLLLLSADPRLRLRLSMLLPNWGLRVSAVETTQEALDRLRTAANQGNPWTYSIVLADLAGMRNTAVALHRNLGRQAVYGQLRLVCLYGDDPVPEELQHGITLLSRQAPDDDLRAALASAVETRTPTVVQREAAATSTVELPVTASTRSARVLLVEDNPVNLMVGQRLLSVLGITCDTASNGEAALMRMSASRYDVVLMDCQMPVMDGYTATQRWRESEEAAGNGRHLPIVAMTANAMAGDRQKCLDAGMDDYLPKPVTRSELERCLHRWWNPAIAAAQAAAHEGTVAAVAEQHHHGADSADAAVVEPEAAGIFQKPADPDVAANAEAMVDADEPVPAIAQRSERRDAVVTPEPKPVSAAITRPSMETISMTWPAQAPSRTVPVSTTAAAAPPASTTNQPAPQATPAPVLQRPAMPPPAAQQPVPSRQPQQAPEPMPAATSRAAAVTTVTSTGSAPAFAAPQQPRMPLPPVIDNSVIEELRAMLGAEVDRLIDIFLEDCPRQIEALENAAIGPDFLALRDAAHSLKSSSANLGAMSLSAAARRIELGAREQAIERPAVAVALVANEFQRAKQALRLIQQASPADGAPGAAAFR